MKQVVKETQADLLRRDNEWERIYPFPLLGGSFFSALMNASAR
jgi:hypothetical protein